MYAELTVYSPVRRLSCFGDADSATTATAPEEKWSAADVIRPNKHATRTCLPTKSTLTIHGNCIIALQQHGLLLRFHDNVFQRHPKACARALPHH